MSGQAGTPIRTNSANDGHRPAIDRIIVRWLLAVMAAASVSVGILGLDIMHQVEPAWSALVAIVCGWAAGVCIVPWKSLEEIRGDRAALTALAQRIRNATREGRSEPLQRIIMDREDEIGQLSQVIHDALAQSISHRVEARMLSRTMDDSIRRETTRATALLQKQATTDPLTGLGNRRCLQERFAEAQGDRRSGPMSVVVFDLDHFKQINDRLGHEVGDRCLVFLGQLLKSHLRADDCAVRLGGDEFVVLLPGLEHAGATAVAERIASLFSAMAWPHGQLNRPGLSYGVASIRPGEPFDPHALLKRADQAMYALKRTRRAA